MNRKTILIILAAISIVISLAITGCSGTQNDSQEAVSNEQHGETKINISEQKENDIQNEASVEYLSLEDAIDQCYCVVTASLNGMYDKETYREYDFNLGQVIIGDMTDSRFSVSEGYAEYTVNNATYSSDKSYSTLNTDYKIGKEYILVLNKISSVYIEDTYKIVGDIFIQLDNEGEIASYQRYHQEEKAEFENIDTFINYISAFSDPSDEHDIIGVPYTDSEEISEIVDVSKYIIKAIVDDVYKELPNRDWDIYRCKVTETLRGETEDDVLILLFKNTVKLDREYVFLLNKENENSITYSLSSAKSVVDVAAQKTDINEIVSIISE